MRRIVGIVILAGAVSFAPAAWADSPAGGPAEEKLLWAGPWKRTMPSYRPVQKPFRPWNIDWEGYPYKDFYPCIAFNDVEAAMPADGRPTRQVVRGWHGAAAGPVQANEVLSLRFYDVPESMKRQVHPTLARDPYVPAGDWRGYELLRMDATFSAAAHIWWAIEDEAVQPPVVGNYDLPAGGAVTLEIDLEKAAKDRGLDLSRMWRLWVRTDLSPGGSGSLGNIRLARRGAKAVHPVLEDAKATRLPAPPGKTSPKAPDVPREAASLAGPVTLTYRSETPLTLRTAGSRGGSDGYNWGFVNAYDQRRVMLCLGDASFQFLDKSGAVSKEERFEIFAVQTLDGGATWTGLDGDKDRSWLFLTTNPTARVVDADGGAVILHEASCGNNPGVRQRLRTFSFLGKAGWTLTRKDHVFNEEARHCSMGGAWVDAVRTPAGRLWVAEYVESRLLFPRHQSIHARHSDDDGRTWQSWSPGRIGRIPEADLTGEGPVPLVTPCGEHVMALWNRYEGNSLAGSFWSVFDGKGWSAPRITGGGHVYWAVTTPAGEVLALTGTWWRKDKKIIPGGVWRFDGKAWTAEKQGLAGEVCLAGGAAFIISADARDKTKFQVHRRSPEGQWQGPATFAADGPVRQHAVPRFGPPGLAPVLYIAADDEKSAKVLLIPNRDLPGK